MLIEDSTFTDLMLALTTNSAPKKYQALLNFFYRNPSISLEIKEKIIETYGELAEKSTNIGRESRKKQKSTKKVKEKSILVKNFSNQRIYSKPGFDYSGFDCTCSTCQKSIPARAPRFFYRDEENNYYNYHVNPICFPTNFANEMFKNPKYIKYINHKDGVSSSGNKWIK